MIELPETINKNKLLANQCGYEKFSIWCVHFNSIIIFRQTKKIFRLNGELSRPRGRGSDQL